MRRREPPPELYFVVSAVFHYLGPAFAVLLFARIDVLGVAWLRIASAAVVFALWRRPWRVWRDLDRETRRLLLAWGAVLALMNCCFYSAIDRMPLGTVAAIEFLPVIALAALGARSRRNTVALALAVAGVALLTDVQLAGEPLGVAFAFANAILFALYIVLAHRVARHDAVGGIDGLALSMLIAAVVVTPIGGAWAAAGVRGSRRARGGYRGRPLFVGDPLRLRPARNGQAEPRHVRPHGRAPARDGDDHRRRRPRPGADAAGDDRGRARRRRCRAAARARGGCGRIAWMGRDEPPQHLEGTRALGEYLSEPATDRRLAEQSMPQRIAQAPHTGHGY